MKHITILVVLFLFLGCINKYSNFEIRTNAGYVVPLAYGTYTLGGLFYALDEPLEVTIKPGKFYSIIDTLVFTPPQTVPPAENLHLVFKAGNLLPFRVDLSVSPYDTISNSIVGNSIFSTIVEAAFYDDERGLIVPVASEHKLEIGSNSPFLQKETNSLIVELDFVWPHDTINVSVVDFFFAFELKVFLEIQL